MPNLFNNQIQLVEVLYKSQQIQESGLYLHLYINPVAPKKHQINTMNLQCYVAVKRYKSLLP